MGKTDVADRGRKLRRSYSVVGNVGPEAKRPKAVRFYRSGVRGYTSPALRRSLWDEEDEVLLLTFPRDSAYETGQRTSNALRCLEEPQLSSPETKIEDAEKTLIPPSGTVDPSKVVEEEEEIRK